MFLYLSTNNAVFWSLLSSDVKEQNRNKIINIYTNTLTYFIKINWIFLTENWFQDVPLMNTPFEKMWPILYDISLLLKVRAFLLISGTHLLNNFIHFRTIRKQVTCMPTKVNYLSILFPLKMQNEVKAKTGCANNSTALNQDSCKTCS